MTFAAVVSLLTALFAAIPTFERWWESLMLEYIKLKKDRITKETREAIQNVFKEQDQRAIEDEDYSGKPSGIGTIRDSLPGVVRDPKKSKSTHLVD